MATISSERWTRKKAGARIGSSYSPTSISGIWTIRITRPAAPRRPATDAKKGDQGRKTSKNLGSDLKDSKGQRVHVDDPCFDQVFELCGRVKIPVLIHTAEPAEFFQSQ